MAIIVRVGGANTVKINLKFSSSYYQPSKSAINISRIATSLNRYSLLYVFPEIGLWLPTVLYS